jgi:iron complex transport system permease protein
VTQPAAAVAGGVAGSARRAGARAGRYALLAAVLVAAALLSLRVGAVGMTTGDVLAALRGAGDPTHVPIVRVLRLPRLVEAALVGAALSVSGAVFQALLRNPLADPYVLGVSGGAAAGAVLAVVLGWALRASWAVPVAAFVGAVTAVALAFRVATAVGRALDTRVLLLAGVVVGAFFNAGVLLLLTVADVESYRSAMFWLMGSLAGATWGEAGLLAAYVAPSLAALLALARALNLLSLGEEPAAYLGVEVGRVKLAAFLVAALLAAAGVAAAGVIGFVGLVVPHAVRIVWGADHEFLLPASALLGAAFLVLVDAGARTVAAPAELPIGVVTALLGVPFFVSVLRRRGVA